METTNLNYYEIAEQFMQFVDTRQKIDAREKLEEYLAHIVNQDPAYAGELIRSIRSDAEFENQLLLSVLQLGCLLTSAIIETVFKYDVVFDVVKKKTINDYEEVKLFKQYLLNTFDIKEFDMVFNDSVLKRFKTRYDEITHYFENY